ncbi:AAA family ATPase [Actinosynnema sp. CS-041913]|uniref:AAA family ATPase n=1 Tax=Actinosynnema sp. CS-041913 TaxID=3239917 RepID=UPI003D920A44
MLRSFRLGNHRSFRDEQELLLIPAYAKDRQSLPVAAVYGANASGKSNLLDGLEFMADAVRDSFGKWSPAGGVPRRPFKLESAGKEKSSVFVIEFIESGVRYTYGFEVDDEKILSEWLYSYPEKRKRLLFERSRDQVKLGASINDGVVRLEVLQDLLRSNALFLSLGAQSNIQDLLPVYRWFVDRMRFRLGNDASSFEPKVAEFLLDNPGLHGKMVDLLRAADFGISNIVVGGERRAQAGISSGRVRLEFEYPVAKADSHRRRRVQLAHGDGGEPFQLADESAGTLSWLGLLPDVLTVLTEGGTLVIDEIDASLHSLLSARLVALFNDPESNQGNGQLIFTTHDATLLHPPLADHVLERDEIWFVEKGADGASTLYPLTDFKPRSEDNLERRYLAGQYGAVPQVYEELFARAVRGGVADGEA